MCFLYFFDDHTWLATLITVFVTTAFAVWQINRQLRNTITAQKSNKMDELHLAIYKEIGEKIEVCQAALSKTYTTTMTIPSFFELKFTEDAKARAAGLQESNYEIQNRYPIVTSEFYASMQKLTEVIFVMDKYEIAFIDFNNMKNNILQTSKNLHLAMSTFHRYILDFLPMDIPEADRQKIGGANVIKLAMPDAAAIAKMRALSDAAKEVNLDITSYLHDLRIEAQNVLLGPIFDKRQVPKRVPGDPRYQVLTLDSENK
ncbi:MAG: hypothetical protein HXX11_13435 [Desulfuromonadales bacterium]|nr:hypothetical protein [Desulfuromonadales bacterium]